jgi:uncharacterized membrane protein
MKTKFDKNLLDSMSKNLNNWKGPFYFNSKDPRFMVPKRHPGFGWTLNFADPLSYVAIVVFILVIVAIIFLTK